MQTPRTALGGPQPRCSSLRGAGGPAGIGTARGGRTAQGAWAGARAQAGPGLRMGKHMSVQSCIAGAQPPRSRSRRAAVRPRTPSPPGRGDATQGGLPPGFYCSPQDRGCTKRVMVPFLPLFFLPHLPPSFLLSLPFIMHAQEGTGGGLS